MDAYQDRIKNVLNYIHSHLGEKHDLGRLAEIAYISKFHFHRIMKAYLGEPLLAYIIRLKIETAARLLKYSDCTISEIAFRIGFETPAAFNKSFKKMYHVAPRIFRQDKARTFQLVKQEVERNQFLLTTEIVIISGLQVLCNQATGAVGGAKTFACWGDLIQFAYRHELITNQTRFIAIHWDDPTITSEKNLRYDACISVQKPISIKSKFSHKKIAAGKHLSVLYRGDYKHLPEVYTQLFKEIVFKENFQLRDEPIFEEFLNNIRETPTSELLTKIYIPIV